MRDSPIEHTGEAHLVTVSCDLCDETYSVSESTAHHNDENDVPFVCSDCSERLSNLHSDMYISNQIERVRLMADLLEEKGMNTKSSMLKYHAKKMEAYEPLIRAVEMCRFSFDRDDLREAIHKYE